MTASSTGLGRRKWELIAQRDPKAIEEIYDADSVVHEPDEDLHGVEEAKRYLSTYLAAFPDLGVTVQDVITEGAQQVTRWTLRGTHRGETEEFGPPTGRQIELEGISIHRTADGKIVEEWERYDSLTVMQQLGLAPT
jgi:steroid delta-isomerase-like uncharacterized protein